ncbi:MAG: TrmB family transcriptional regulator [Oceanospirillaceae bacterium]|nr:TrmB family transcriptional regulator [Oceanospirillaceae bacterium]
MILGELEKQVLNYLWDNDEANAKQVHTAFNAERPGSLNTIQSTLERLYKKKLLSRRKSSHAYIYRPRVKREALMARLIRDVTQEFKQQNQNTTMAAFASLTSDLSDDELDQLEALIEARRQSESGDQS